MASQRRYSSGVMPARSREAEPMPCTCTGTPLAPIDKAVRNVWRRPSQLFSACGPVCQGRRCAAGNRSELGTTPSGGTFRPATASNNARRTSRGYMLRSAAPVSPLRAFTPSGMAICASQAGASSPSSISWR